MSDREALRRITFGLNMALYVIVVLLFAGSFVSAILYAKDTEFDPALAESSRGLLHTGVFTLIGTLASTFFYADSFLKEDDGD